MPTETFVEKALPAVIGSALGAALSYLLGRYMERRKAQIDIGKGLKKSILDDEKASIRLFYKLLQEIQAMQNFQASEIPEKIDDLNKIKHEIKEMFDNHFLNPDKLTENVKNKKFDILDKIDSYFSVTNYYLTNILELDQHKKGILRPIDIHTFDEWIEVIQGNKNKNFDRLQELYLEIQADFAIYGSLISGERNKYTRLV